MRPQSAKAKGRRLQQELVAAILATFDAQLQPDDVTSRSMGAGGCDVLISPAARRCFPFAPECKNTESLNIWKAIAQAEENAAAGTTGIVVFRRNNVKPYVALPLDVFMDLTFDAYQHANP